LTLSRLYWIFIFSLAVFFPSVIFAQPGKDSKVKYIEVRSAHRFIYDKKIGAQRLIGGVNCVHEGVEMTCDSAWLYDNNTLEAFSNITIRQGDSLFMRGDKLKYDGKTKIAALEGKVTCIEKDMTLTTNILTYDVEKATASYYSGGTIQSKNNTLTSRNGYYHSPSKTMSFRYNVKLKNPEYTMECDTLQYNTVSRTAYFTGPTTVYSDSTIIKTEYGWYSTISETCRLLKNSEIRSGKQILRGDSIFYERKRGYGLVLGNVIITDTAGESVVSGGKAEYWENAGLSIISRKAMYTQYFEKDTLFMGADTLYSWSDSKTGEKVLRAYYNCRFYKSDMQGACDSVVYKTEDSLMMLYNSPLLWNGDNQLSAKQVAIKTGNKKIYSFTLIDDAFVIAKKDSAKFNQIKGRNIDGFFKDDKLNRINVKGNAQAVYYLEQNKKIIGVNKTECSEMSILTGEKGIEEITFRKKPVASVVPIKDVKPEELKLKGFKWSAESRPRGREDLFK
jgi:lipopolysaccharide export system protein LptA